MHFQREISNENMFEEFLEEVKSLKTSNALQWPIDSSRIFQNLSLLHKVNNRVFSSIEEIAKLKKKIDSENMYVDKKMFIKKKWSEDEKILLVLVVYLYLKIHKKVLNELVLSFLIIF